MKRMLLPDLIRSSATIFVILIHAIGVSFTELSRTSFSNQIAVLLLHTLSKSAVPIFVLLSGSLILSKFRGREIVDYKKSLLNRIIPALVIWSAIYYIGANLINGSVMTIPDFITRFLLLRISPHLYFLFIIAGLYLLAPALYKVTASLSAQKSFYLLLTFFLLTHLLTRSVYLGPIPINYWTSLTIFLPFIGYFYAGNVISLHRHRLPKIKWLVATVLSLLLIITALKYYAIDNHSDTLFSYFSDALHGLNVMLSVSLFSLFYTHYDYVERAVSSFGKRSIQSIAKVSFGVYLIHPIVQYAISTQPFVRFYYNNIFVILISSTVVLTVSAFFAAAPIFLESIKTRLI